MKNKGKQNIWQLQTAKSKFSAVVDAALAGEPQLVTRNNKPAVYVVAVDDYNKLAEKSGLKDLLLSSPHKEIELKLERLRDAGRVNPL